MRLVLASESERRKAIMKGVFAQSEHQLTFRSSGVNEFAIGDWAKHTASDLTARIAKAKAYQVAEQERQAVVVAADTLVVMGEREKRGKPTNDAEMLRFLYSYRESGVRVQVVTSVHVVNTGTGRHRATTDHARLFFLGLNDQDLMALARAKELRDCAGGIMVGHPLWEGKLIVRGRPDTVQGLPGELVRQMVQAVL